MNDPSHAAPRPPSIILLDIDGTLVNYSAELPASAAAAVREARQRGHRIYLCTGRSKAEIYDHLWELGVDGLIGGNGSYIEDGEAVVFHQVIDPAAVERAIAWMESRGLGYYLECNTGLFGSTNLGEKMATIPGVTVTVDQVFPHMVFDTTQGHEDVNKISFVLEPGIDLAVLAEEFPEAKIDSWTATGRAQEFGEFGQFGVHKGAAVQRLAEHRGVDVADLIAFGDARPDIELLTTCGTGVAMGNAPDEVKAIATFVTDHVDDDGLTNAFRRLGLIG